MIGNVVNTAAIEPGIEPAAHPASLPDWVAQAGSLPDWDALRKDIVSRLDIASVYRGLGVKLSDRVGDGMGWVGCWPHRGTGRVAPSEGAPAFVNLRTGYFRSRDGAECLDLFEFMASLGECSSYYRAIEQLSWQSDVALPTTPALDRGGFLEKVRRYDEWDGGIIGWTGQFRERRGAKSVKLAINLVGATFDFPYRSPASGLPAIPLPTYILTSEDDVDRAIAEGLVATCHVPDRWRPESWGRVACHLEGHDFVVVTTGSPIMQRHAERVAASLFEVAWSIRIVPVPEVPADGGLIHFLEGGRTVAEFEALAASTPFYKSPEE